MWREECVLLLLYNPGVVQGPEVFVWIKLECPRLFPVLSGNLWSSRVFSLQVHPLPRVCSWGVSVIDPFGISGVQGRV